MFHYASAFNISNIWYVSDYGSDENDCHSASAPCRNLQAVLDRATYDADIYVISPTLSLGMIIKRQGWEYSCMVESSISYTITTYNETHFTPTCRKSNHNIYYDSFFINNSLIMGHDFSRIQFFNWPRKCNTHQISQFITNLLPELAA